jgi:hypothetical protein
MHLNSNQLFRLSIPFLLSIVVYYFSDEITQNVKYLFPTYKEYRNKVLDKKADIYLKIEAKNKTYRTILHRLQEREKKAQWIADTILYKKVKVENSVVQKKVLHASKKYTKTPSFNVQAIFYNKKVAIINGKMVQESSILEGAKIIKIEKNKILIQHHKGTKWLYLFH